MHITISAFPYVSVKKLYCIHHEYLHSLVKPSKVCSYFEVWEDKDEKRDIFIQRGHIRLLDECSSGCDPHDDISDRNIACSESIKVIVTFTMTHNPCSSMEFCKFYCTFRWQNGLHGINFASCKWRNWSRQEKVS